MSDLETRSLLSRHSASRPEHGDVNTSSASIRARSAAEIGVHTTDSSGCCGRMRCSCCPAWHPSKPVIVVAMLGVSEGVLNNLGLFLHCHGLRQWSTTQVTVLSLLVACVPQILSPVTGSLGDWRFSRFVILYWGLLLQCLGSLCLLACAMLQHYTVHQTAHSQLRTLDILAVAGVVLFSLGTTACRGASIVLGMEQYWLRGESGEKAKEFFPLYYWCLNASGAIVIGLLSFVQLNFGFHIGLIPVCVSYALAFLILHCYWNRLYSTTHLAETGGLTKIWKVLREAWRVWRLKKSTATTTGAAAGRYGVGGNRLQGTLTSKPLSWWSYSELNFGGRFHANDVMDVRNFISLLLVLLPTLFYNVILSQTLTTFTTQGSRMKVLVEHGDHEPDGDRDDSHHLFLPASAIAAVSCLAVCVFIPLLYGVVYPRLEGWSGCWRITLFRRMGIGMLMAVLSVGCAAAVEFNRRTPERWNATTQIIPMLTDTNHTASSLSIFWQVPQYVFSGLAETLVYISALEFAYAKSPQTMKGLCVALVYAMEGMSGLLSAGLMTVLVANSANFFYQDDQPGEVQWFFLSLGGIILAGIVLFTITTCRYKYLRRTCATV